MLNPRSRPKLANIHTLRASLFLVLKLATENCPLNPPSKWKKQALMKGPSNGVFWITHHTYIYIHSDAGDRAGKTIQPKNLHSSIFFLYYILIQSPTISLSPIYPVTWRGIIHNITFLNSNSNFLMWTWDLGINIYHLHQRKEVSACQ